MRKYFFIIIFSILLAISLGWGIGEAFVRYNYPYWNLNMALKYAPSIFNRHRLPNKKRTVHKRADPSDTLVINSSGFRGEELARHKPENQFRIMILGGSQVFSAGTGQVGWPNLVEKKLRKKLVNPVEVINAGVPGYASFDSIGRLISYGHYFDPDIVILNNAWNDIKYFHYEKPPIQAVKPYRPSGNPRRNYLNTLDKYLGNASQFYLFLRTKYFSWNFNPRKSMDFYRRKKVDKISNNAIKQFKLSTRTFLDVTKNIDAKPIILKQPRLLVEENPDAVSKKVNFGVQNLSRTSVIKAYNLIDRFYREISSKNNVSMIHLKEIDGREKFFHDHVHFTPRGAEAVSRKLADRLYNLYEGNKI